MIFWIVIYGVACFMFGYFISNRMNAKDDKQNTKESLNSEYGLYVDTDSVGGNEDGSQS